MKYIKSYIIFMILLIIASCNKNEKDLLEALNQNQIAGAAIDCFENEPRPLEDIVNHPRVTVTPHIGASTNEAQKRIAYEIVDIVSDYYDCLLEGAAGC